MDGEGGEGTPYCFLPKTVKLKANFQKGLEDLQL